jgi:hypothetical protein
LCRANRVRVSAIGHHRSEGGDDHRRHRGGRPAVDRLEFETWRPAVAWLGGVKRVRFGDPAWRPIAPRALDALVVGGDLDGWDGRQCRRRNGGAPTRRPGRLAASFREPFAPRPTRRTVDGAPAAA